MIKKIIFLLLLFIFVSQVHLSNSTVYARNCDVCSDTDCCSFGEACGEDYTCKGGVLAGCACDYNGCKANQCIQNSCLFAPATCDATPECAAPEDCQQASPVCGDGSCNGSEDALTCPQDCTTCGDKACTGNENTTNCPSDCGITCNGTACPGPLECQGGVNPCEAGSVCWCPSTVASCTTAADCTGDTTCPGNTLCGVWVCRNGSCVSSCNSCDNPSPTVAPCQNPGATTCGACSSTCGGGTQTCTNACGSYNQQCNNQPCTGSIQGYKVNMPGNTVGEPVSSQTVYLDSTDSTALNPYLFSDISAASHTVSVSNPNPANYSISYTMCVSTQNQCGAVNDPAGYHSVIPTSGSSVTTNVPGGGFVDLWWHFTCSDSAPTATTSISPVFPTNAQTLGNVYVLPSFTDSASTDWGFVCPGTTENDTYTVQYTLSSDPAFSSPATFCTISSGSPLSCPQATLTDQTDYLWRVVKSNGAAQQVSNTWSFNIRIPVISGKLYEDANKDACYAPGDGERAVPNPPTNITVSATNLGVGTPVCSTTVSDYTCTVPIPNSGNPSSTLSTSGFTPDYTAQTGCSTGQNICGSNSCAIFLAPGDTKTINIGFATTNWYQANGCDVYSGGDLASIIPNAPLDFDTGGVVSKYFVLGQAGPVLTGSSSTLEFGSSGGTASEPAPVREYQDTGYATTMVQDYAFFKRQLSPRSTQMGSGETYTLQNGDLKDLTGSDPNTYTVSSANIWDINGNVSVVNATGLSSNNVFLVSGVLNFDGNFQTTQSVAFVSQGNITVNGSVSEIDAALVTDGQYTDNTSATGLKIIGSVAANAGMTLGREQLTAKPSEYFVCNPKLYIDLSNILGLSSYTWQEVAP